MDDQMSMMTGPGLERGNTSPYMKCMIMNLALFLSFNISTFCIHPDSSGTSRFASIYRHLLIADYVQS